jgi:hypothetical protein
MVSAGTAAAAMGLILIKGGSSGPALFLLLHLVPHSLVDFAFDKGLLFPSSAEFPGIDEVDSRFFEVRSVAGGQGCSQCHGLKGVSGVVVCWFW